MNDEQQKILFGYLEIISRQLEFLCKSYYYLIAAGDETAPDWDTIAEQEIYYGEEDES